MKASHYSNRMRNKCGQKLIGEKGHTTMIFTLPDEILLQKLFRHFNKIYWNNLLPEAAVVWSHTMFTAGKCYVASQGNGNMEYEIVLSWRYHLRFPGEIITTLKHEMIHLTVPEHDERFFKEANRVGTRTYAHVLTIPWGRYEYRCKQCSFIHYEDRLNLLLPCPRCTKTSMLEFTGMRAWEYYQRGTRMMLITTKTKHTGDRSDSQDAEQNF
jgi:predicted Zn-ribbon and HTH transcriptional regulator